MRGGKLGLVIFIILILSIASLVKYKDKSNVLKVAFPFTQIMKNIFGTSIDHTFSLKRRLFGESKRVGGIYGDTSELKKQLDQLAKDLQTNQKKVEDLERAKAAIEVRLDNKNAEYDTLRQELNEIRKRLADALEEQQRLTALNTELTGNLTVMTTERDRIQAELDDKTREIDRLGHKHQTEIMNLQQKHQDEIDRLEQKQRDEIMNLQQKHQDEIDKLKQKHQDEIANLQQQITGLQEQLSNKNREIEAATQTHAQALERSNADHGREIGELRTEIQTLKEKLQQWDPKIRIIARDLKLTPDNQDIPTILNGIANAVTILSESESTLKTENAQLKQRISELEEELKKLQTESARLQREIDDLKSEKSQLEQTKNASGDELQQRLDTVTDERNKARQDREKLQKELKDEQAKNADLQRHLKELQRQLQEALGKQSSAENRSAQQQTKIDQNAAKITELKERIRNLETQIQEKDGLITQQANTIREHLNTIQERNATIARLQQELQNLRASTTKTIAERDAEIVELEKQLRENTAIQQQLEQVQSEVKDLNGQIAEKDRRIQILETMQREIDKLLESDLFTYDLNYITTENLRKLVQKFQYEHEARMDAEITRIKQENEGQMNNLAGQLREKDQEIIQEREKYTQLKDAQEKAIQEATENLKQRLQEGFDKEKEELKKQVAQLATQLQQRSDESEELRNARTQMKFDADRIAQLEEEHDGVRTKAIDVMRNEYGQIKEKVRETFNKFIEDNKIRIENADINFMTDAMPLREPNYYDKLLPQVSHVGSVRSPTTRKLGNSPQRSPTTSPGQESSYATADDQRQQSPPRQLDFGDTGEEDEAQSDYDLFMDFIQTGTKNQNVIGTYAIKDSVPKPKSREKQDIIYPLESYDATDNVIPLKRLGPYTFATNGTASTPKLEFFTLDKDRFSTRGGTPAHITREHAFIKKFNTGAVSSEARTVEIIIMDSGGGYRPISNHWSVYGNSGTHKYVNNKNISDFTRFLTDVQINDNYFSASNFEQIRNNIITLITDRDKVLFDSLIPVILMNTGANTNNINIYSQLGFFSTGFTKTDQDRAVTITKDQLETNIKDIFIKLFGNSKYTNIFIDSLKNHESYKHKTKRISRQ